MLGGDRHTAKYAPDGRLLISYRGVTPGMKRLPGGKELSGPLPTAGDWAAWVGTWEDLVSGKLGQYLLRLKDNHLGADTAYPGVERLPDGTFVLVTYGHWTRDESPYLLSVRLRLEELDARAATAPRLQFSPGGPSLIATP